MKCDRIDVGLVISKPPSIYNIMCEISIWHFVEIRWFVQWLYVDVHGMNHGMICTLCAFLHAQFCLLFFLIKLRTYFFSYWFFNILRAVFVLLWIQLKSNRNRSSNEIGFNILIFSVFFPVFFLFNFIFRWTPAKAQFYIVIYFLSSLRIRLNGISVVKIAGRQIFTNKRKIKKE